MVNGAVNAQEAYPDGLEDVGGTSLAVAARMPVS